MTTTIAAIEGLERRLFLTAGPTATFLQYIKGTGSSRTFAILYDGPATIGRATLDDGDVRVFSDQDQNLPATFLGATRHKPGTGLIAQYRVDGLASGTFSIEVQPQQISDTNGGVVQDGVIGSFKIAPNGQASIMNAMTPTIQVLGTTHGTSENPPAIDTSFGNVVRAINFGGDPISVAGNTGVMVPFEGNTGTPGAKRKHPRGARIASPIQITITAGNSNLYQATVGDNPLFETEIFNPTWQDQLMNIDGLDPAKRYQIQFLHGDTRLDQNPYVSTPQFFKISNGQTVTTPLEFGTSEETEDSDTSIVVSGTTSVSYSMPQCPTRGPSFSGVVIEEADFSQPSAPKPTFARGSVRFSGTAQLFDIGYAPIADVPTSALAAQELEVTGPRGFLAIASLIDTRPGKHGLGVVATYRIEGIDLTASYTISLAGQKVATATFFHLRPIIWE